MKHRPYTNTNQNILQLKTYNTPLKRARPTGLAQNKQTKNTNPNKLTTKQIITGPHKHTKSYISKTHTNNKNIKTKHPTNHTKTNTTSLYNIYQTIKQINLKNTLKNKK